jgi:hypothetical protein
VSGAVAVNSWPGSTMFPRLTVPSFVRPATAHALTIRAGSCSPLPRVLRSLANEASGRRGLASPSGSGCDRRRHAGALGPRRPCPPRARSTGNWRSLAVNNGRQHTALTCTIGLASGRDDATGRAFQARDIGATSGHERADRSGQQRSPPARHLPSSQAHSPHPAAGHREPPRLPDTEEAMSLDFEACVLGRCLPDRAPARSPVRRWNRIGPSGMLIVTGPPRPRRCRGR